jgi:hypothetical protein
MQLEYALLTPIAELGCATLRRCELEVRDSWMGRSIRKVGSQLHPKVSEG